MGSSDTDFIENVKHAKNQALKHSSILTNHIEESAKLLQRSFKIFKGIRIKQIKLSYERNVVHIINCITFFFSFVYELDLSQIREGQMKSLNHVDKQEDQIKRYGKKRTVTNDLESYNSVIKRLRETEDKLFSTQQLLRQLYETETLETIIINDDGLSRTQDIEKIINEINKGEIMLDN